MLSLNSLNASPSSTHLHQPKFPPKLPALTQQGMTSMDRWDPRGRLATSLAPVYLRTFSNVAGDSWWSKSHEIHH